jgi:hypothetical protein
VLKIHFTEIPPPHHENLMLLWVAKYRPNIYKYGSS